ncbi:RNA-guided endonuclease InsQ/TnpB family protein [Streptomyces sp. NPDC004376]
MQLRYSFRLYPGAGQRAALARAFGCARVVYNDALRARETARSEDMPFPKTGDLSKTLITEAKKTPERAWLAEVSAVILQQSLRDLDTAYRNFFDGLKGKRPRMGAPRYKSRKDTRQTVRFTANARWLITPGGKLRLPKIGDLQEVGIDLGLTHFAVLSDGRKIDSPRFLRRAEKRLKKAQRELSRKEKDSKNRDKARVRVARAHARVADARREFHHRLSTKLIGENQAIAVEDLAVKGLARTRLAKFVHDAGWSAFVNMLEYKAARYGRTFIRIGRFEPTSQVCSQCGVKDGPKPLHVRVWTCSACGAILDRDVNAAVNVAKAAGLAVSACGAQVRRAPVPAPRSEAGTHPTSQPSAAR